MIYDKFNENVCDFLDLMKMIHIVQENNGTEFSEEPADFEK